MQGLTILGLYFVSRMTNIRGSLEWGLRSMEVVFVCHDAPHLV